MGATRRKAGATAAQARGKKGPRTRLDVEARRAQLVSLGLELFGDRPYDEVSIDEVAAAAGISKGLLYHYFPTKRDFYVATIREAARQLLERSLSFEELPLDERPRAGLDAYLAYVERAGKAYTTLFRGGIGSDAEVLGIIEETRSRFMATILGGLGVSDPPPALRVAMRGWIGLAEATSLDWVERPTLSREALRDLLADCFREIVAVALRHAARAPAAEG